MTKLFRKYKSWALLDAPYNPQSKGALETFNKAGQRAPSKADDNTQKDEKEKFDLKLNLHLFFTTTIDRDSIWQLDKF